MPPPQPVVDAGRRYATDQAALTQQAVATTDVGARRIDGDESQWRDTVAVAAPDLLVLQTGAAALADPYVTDSLEAQDADPSGDASVSPGGFADHTDGGGSYMRNLVYAPNSAYRDAVNSGAGTTLAASRARYVALSVVLNAMQDTARSAVATSMFTRPAVRSYVRALRGKSCARCVVLAGRRYRVSGFRRHLRCDCYMIPAAEDASDDWPTDPRAYFASLSRAEQDTIFTPAGARAIRGGANPAQVVNANEGVSVVSGVRTTTTGTTKRGVAGQRLQGQARLMPDEIFRSADQQGWSREETLRELSRHGYVT